MPIITGGSSGGSSPSIHTGTLATDPNTYVASVDVDLSGPSLVVVSFQPTIFTAGGAVFGTGAGNVGGSFGVTQSYDDAAFAGLGGSLTLNVTDANGLMSDLANHEGQIGTAWRYLRIATAIYVSDTFEPYAGPNHPVMTGTYTVTATALT